MLGIRPPPKLYVYTNQSIKWEWNASENPMLFTISFHEEVTKQTKPLNQPPLDIEGTENQTTFVTHPQCMFLSPHCSQNIPHAIVHSKNIAKSSWWLRALCELAPKHISVCSKCVNLMQEVIARVGLYISLFLPAAKGLHLGTRQWCRKIWREMS